MPKDKPVNSNDDAPIIIADTSLPLMMVPTKDETTVCHEAAPGNQEHYHNNAKNCFYVHDKEKGKGKDYQAVCFDFASLTKSIAIPANATSWEISFEDDYREVLSINWVDHLIGEKDRGDITLEAMGATQHRTDKTKIHLAARVKTMRWRINEGLFSGPITPKDKELVTVHYCPDGGCTVDPCK